MLLLRYKKIIIIITKTKIRFIINVISSRSIKRKTADSSPLESLKILSEIAIVILENEFENYLFPFPLSSFLEL